MRNSRLKRFQPKGNTWEKRALKKGLRAVLDPEDRRGYINYYMDLLHKTVLSKYIPSLKDKMILDFGCGIGRISSWLADKGYEVIGIDITKNIIYSAKKSCPHCDFILYDGETLPFRDSSFDYIVSVWVLQHVNIMKDFKKIVKELVRCLKPNGVIYLIEQVSSKKSDYYIHRMPEEYIDAFEDCKCIFKRPIRNSNSLFDKAIALGLIPRVMFPIIIRIRLSLIKNISVPEKGYLDYFFIFKKKIKNGRDLHSKGS